MTQRLQFYSRSADPALRVLSNFTLLPDGAVLRAHVTVRGATFTLMARSVEHAYQGLKWVAAGYSLDAQRLFFGPAPGYKTAREAKRGGGQAAFRAAGVVLTLNGDDLYAIMAQLLQARAEADNVFVNALLATGDAQLYHFERSGARSTWGGNFPGGDMSLPFRGGNALGRLLMELRATLRDAMRHAVRQAVQDDVIVISDDSEDDN
jgi:hypothetical protein